jgi:hypothetical protein
MTTSGVSKKLMLNVQMVCLALIVISSPVYANLIRNGDFATGDFADWTLITTPNGDLGVGPLPRITLFDVSGTGPTIAAEFQVGQVTLGPRAGGGIEQIVTTDAGLYRFRADIAAFSTRVDPDAGNVSVLVDNISEDTVNFGPINSKPPFMPLLRGALTFTTAFSAGMHEIEILITRDLQNTDLSPDQFITNITLAPVPQADPAPEPATWTILGVALAGLAIGRRRLSQHQGRRRHFVARRSG